MSKERSSRKRVYACRCGLREEYRAKQGSVSRVRLCGPCWNALGDETKLLYEPFQRESSNVWWALTLTQPYAWMVIHGPKDIENRSWVNDILRELIERKEPFAVHAGKECTLAYYRDAVEYAASQDPGLVVPPREQLVYGAILGTVVPHVIHPPSEWSPDRPWHMEGQNGWGLRERKPLLHYLPVSGKQGFWRVPEELVPMLRGGGCRLQAAGSGSGEEPRAKSQEPLVELRA